MVVGTIWSTKQVNIMMRYYLKLKERIEGYVENQYEFKIKSMPRAKAGVLFSYRPKGKDTWLPGDQFGKLERETIAETSEFLEYKSSIKMYFPYHWFNKMATDIAMQEKARLVYS